MVIRTKEHGRMDFNMTLVYINGRMEGSILDPGKTGKSMDTECYYGKMGKSTKVDLKMTISKDLVALYG